MLGEDLVEPAIISSTNDAERPGMKVSPGADLWLKEHLDVVKESITAEANKVASKQRRSTIEPSDIAQATLHYAPGHQLVLQESAWKAFGRNVIASVTGVTIVSAILAIAFGVIGWIVAKDTAADAGQLSSGAFDIAKIFAGAIVGSTSATVITNRN